MASVATTRMSSKGQVVIPESLRRQLGLEAGTEFVVGGADDVIVLKALKPLAMNDFDHLIRQARAQARQVGLRRSDIARSVAAVRHNP